MEGQEDADHENAEDEPVEAGIAGEGGGDLPGEDSGDEGDDGEEHQHRQDEDLRAGQPVRVVLHHVGRADQAQGPQYAHSRPDSVPGDAMSATLSGIVTKLEDANGLQPDIGPFRSERRRGNR